MKNILTFAAALLLIYSCSPTKGEQSEQVEENNKEIIDKPTPVKTIRLEMSDFNHDLIANGTIASQQVAELKFLTSEKITGIYVKNGNRVVKGQKLAELDQFKLRSTMLQSKDNLERAKLELQDVLIGQGYSLRDSLKIPADVMKIAKVKSNYDQSMLNFQMAEYNLKNAVLYAPFTGVVANLFTKEFNYPSGSEPFCSIIDNNHPEVEFKILENEVTLVNKGDRVSVSPFSITDYISEGRITEINPLVDKNGMVYVKAILPASAKLVDGMNVKVLIQRSISRQLVIPKEALVLRTNKKVVFTLKKGVAYWNYVTTGLENSSGYVVTDGLHVGDSVIYDGNVNLAHESPVTVMQ
ncbi:MAG: efflux RND transporter periplasmic adaptor subunit [Paludibacter sp.]|nr:efflux RND transporter periplasmic adaptor subunit [Paludibacter sp.]